MKPQKYDRKNRKSNYGVRWGHWKKPSYKFFITAEERNEFLAELIFKEREEGKAALRITTLEAQIMKTCVELMGSPENVLALCKEHSHLTSLKKVNLDIAVKEFLDEKMNIGRDDNYLRAARNILFKLKSYFPGTILFDLTQDDAREWIQSIHLEPTTIINHKKMASTFFNWCVKRKYCRENIFKNAPVPDHVMPEPEFLSLCQFKQVMCTAIEHYPDTVAYFSLQAFAGIRASACARLENKFIKTESKGILIRSDMAKNKRRIFVDGHPEVLWQWLDFAKSLAPEGFAMSKRLYDRRKDQIARTLGYRMPHNALRHSFCTYHVAMNGDAGKTATLLTHRGSVEELYEHYRGNATQAEGKAWFNLLPPNYPS